MCTHNHCVLLWYYDMWNLTMRIQKTFEQYINMYECHCHSLPYIVSTYSKSFIITYVSYFVLQYIQGLRCVFIDTLTWYVRDILNLKHKHLSIFQLLYGTIVSDIVLCPMTNNYPTNIQVSNAIDEELQENIYNLCVSFL